MRRIKIRLRTVVAFSAMTLALSPVLALSAGASNAKVPVASGIDAASIPGAVAFGSTPASTPEQVSFILDEQNANQLSAAVESGVKSFLTVSQFAATYGQSAANISALESYLTGFGITSSAYADGIDVSATGTAGEFDAALSVTQNNYHAPGNGHGQDFHGTTTDPELPANLASFVEGVLGLTNYAPFSTSLAHATKLASTVKATGGSTTTHYTAAECEALTTLPAACNLPSDFESNYGLSTLEGEATGSGVTLGIVTLAALDVGAPETFWSSVADVTRTGTLSVENVDGGPGAPNGNSIETDLDTEQSGAIAPGANVIVYQAPNTDYGFLDAFAQAASENVASTISSSWGESETVISYFVSQGGETSAYQGAFDEVFQEMAIQGQSGFVSAGDAAAYDDSNELGTTELSIDSPGNSPYITTAGGTTLPWNLNLGTYGTLNVASQRAWGWDYLWPFYSAFGFPSEQTAAFNLAVGGGGGFSTLESSPSYQHGVQGTHSYSAVEYLTPTDFVQVGAPGSPYTAPVGWNFNPTPNVTNGASNGRAVPDLSTDADPETGYLLWSPQVGGLGGGWGGTSFVAPQLNGSTALIDSYLGHRVGLWNPAIYAAASSKNSPFTPLNTAGTSNDNLFYTGNAGTVYNPASGLGVPNLGALAGDLN